ncbi:hypothetical protein ATANTOWER_022039 [Ataeniobius toweri]|uniref:Uncharacterized protein n=1 Tax=Ataeniobius toweri TaxID=208326 RepID=A0ABU7AST1_9TELE|nr:hypothetical protein [Ataeniobius toweri]
MHKKLARKGEGGGEERDGEGRRGGKRGVEYLFNPHKASSSSPDWFQSGCGTPVPICIRKDHPRIPNLEDDSYLKWPLQQPKHKQPFLNSLGSLAAAASLTSALRISHFPLAAAFSAAGFPHVSIGPAAVTQSKRARLCRVCLRATAAPPGCFFHPSC